MTDTPGGPEEPGVRREVMPEGLPVGPPPGVPVGMADFGPAHTPSGPPLGPDGKPLGRPPGIPAGAVVMGGLGGGGPHAGPTSARRYLGRSVKLLTAVRGSVLISIALGFIVTLLPFVVTAAFGALMSTLGKLAAQGNFDHSGSVWTLTGKLFDRADGGTSGLFGWLATPLPFAVLLVVWSGAVVLSQLLGIVRSRIDAQVEWKLLAAIRQRVHDHLQSLSLDFFSGQRTGLLMERVQMESTGVQRLLTDCLIPPAIDAVVLAVAITYMLALSWQMTIVSLVLSPLALITLRYAGTRAQATTARQMTSSRQLSSELAETIDGISDVQIFNAQQQRSERFQVASESAARNSSVMMFWAQLSNKSAQVFIALSTALVLVVGVVYGARFGLTVASLVTFVGLAAAMFDPAQRIITSYTTYLSIVPQIVSTYELLDTEATVAERLDAKPLGTVHGHIVFEDVTFGYTPNQKILDGLSFSINEGETVAVVGEIGAGKSTIFNLLLRFLDPQRGRILLDGTDIGEVTLSSLREQVSKLAQFPFFMKESIRENVRLGRRGASDVQVEEACELAHIHSVIVDPTRIARGYDTIVDVQVPSGGQKRLIAMARCLLRKPEVLLLDEPTENIDAEQRMRLTRVIREYARDRTCIVISHDMDFIAAVADRIIVLKNGRVAEDGTHAELLEGGGLYRELYDAQNTPRSVR